MKPPIKHYLHPRALRRGSSVLFFIEQSNNGRTPRYELSVYHYRIAPSIEDNNGQIKIKPYAGEGWEYQAMCAIKISKELYDALKKEAQANHARLRKNEVSHSPRRRRK